MVTIDAAESELPVFAIILAAGRGTRMGVLTATTPKPLLRLRGRPIIEHILSGLRAAGVEDGIIITGYRAEQLETHLGNGERLGMRLTYRRQETADGTARAVLLARHAVGKQPFIVSWGDIVVEPSTYSTILTAFAAVPCDALLAVNTVDDPWRGAAVYVDGNGHVSRLIEKPARGTSHTHWNNAGIFACTPLVFAYAERLQPSARGEYELPQALAAMIDDGRVIRAQPVRGFWSDLGTPEDIEAAERTLESHNE